MTAGNKGDVEGQKKSSPRSIIFLVLFRRGRHRRRDCWIQGARGRPEEVISQINHIFLYSSGEADIEEETAGNKGHVEGQKKSSPRSIIFSCTLQERQTSKKRLLDTRGTWKARRSHLPDQSYFLVLFRRGRHRRRDCRKQGARGRPEEVISHINHIFLYSSGEADIEEETAGYKGHVEGQKKSSPRSIIFSCTLQERQTSKKRLLDTRGTWKARRSHLPDQSYFLVLFRRGRHRRRDCRETRGTWKARRSHLPHQSYFPCTLQERQTSTKRLLDTRGTWKARRSHLPDQSYFLVLFRRGRHRRRDCRKQGARGRPEEVISHINHIFLYSSGEADIEEETAGYKGHVEGQKKSSPRSINFLVPPQGSCLVAVSPRDKHLLFAEGREETPEI